MDQQTDPHIEAMKALAFALMDGRSDWKVGLGAVIRAVEDRQPGFVQQIAAMDTLKRLGLPLREGRLQG